MFRSLVWKEILDHLLSFRFVAGLLFVFALFIASSLIFSKKYAGQYADYRQQQQAQEAALDVSKGGLQRLYRARVPTMKEPRLTLFFASGNESRFPQSLTVVPSASSRGGLYAGMNIAAQRSNYKLDSYHDFDIVFIVGVVLSFLAIVLSYDGISGERARGTLKQQLSNPIFRIQVVLAKYAAILIPLLIPVVLGSLVCVIVILLQTGQNILFLYPLQSLLNTVLSALFLSIFVWLGLWMSAATSRSVTSLSLLLLVWTFIVILSPSLGGMVAQRFHHVSGQADYDRKFQQFVNEALRKAPAAYSDYYAGKQSEQGWKDIEQFFETQNTVMEGMVVSRFNELLGQAETADRFNFFSPYGAFRQSVERLSNTGLSYHKKFFDASLRYRHTLASFIKETDLRDQESSHRLIPFPGMLSISTKPLDPNQIPRFALPSRQVSMMDLQNALPGILYLVFANIVAFFLTIGTFSRADVR